MFAMHKSRLAGDRSVISEETTLHGFFRDIKPGGRNALFITIQGDAIECALTQDVVEIAVYAQSIDAVVSLEGVAQRDTETFAIVSFFASSAKNIQQEIVGTFEHLSESYGHYFDEIGDV